MESSLYTTTQYNENGYLAAVLSEESSALLKEIAIHPEVYCHHLTLAYRPSAEVWQKYEHLLGRKIKLEVIGIGFNEETEAALVNGCPTENEYPHITISCEKNVPPKCSNELFTKNNIIPIKFFVEAEVKFIPFEKTF